VYVSFDMIAVSPIGLDGCKIRCARLLQDVKLVRLVLSSVALGRVAHALLRMRLAWQRLAHALVRMRVPCVAWVRLAQVSVVSV
jgi:hypothetical protein